MRIDFKKNYQAFVNHFKNTAPDQAMSLAVGGNFDYIGSTEKHFLTHIGLKQSDYIIDIGCGSGRLTKHLVPYITTGKYLGIDIIPDLLDNARGITDNNNFRFELTDGFHIPESDIQADYIVLFSVFTHLLQDEIYLYLNDIKRVLKPGGKVVFTFFEFTDLLWPIFEEEVKHIGTPHPLNVFISRDAINAWAKHLNMAVLKYYDANTVLDINMEPVQKDDGTIHNRCQFEQSVCILSKFSL
ncbi:MAG: class I SAM-dependent methyltransferase [Syntrophobacteraceae bacterium]